MDWNSKEGRALLWQAYPAPLGLPGLHTVGGLTCIVGASAPRGTAVYVSYDIENVVDDRLDRLMPAVGEVIVSLKGKVISANPWSLREAEGRIAMGDLLPNPDPSDVATWACLLAHLADAEGSVGMAPGDEVVGLAWAPDFASSPRRWHLSRYTKSGIVLQRCAWQFDTDDPAEALVLALIQLRASREE